MAAQTRGSWAECCSEVRGAPYTCNLGTI